jgi:uncharacterized protein YecE (DUF72 family)
VSHSPFTIDPSPITPKEQHQPKQSIHHNSLALQYNHQAMEFGRVPQHVLSTIDFSLPQEPAGNRVVLSGNKNPGLKIYTGCATWGRKEWLGKVYPLNTKENQFLDHYVKQFNCIELNATHYKIYDALAIGKWAARATGTDFMFCPKVPQEISHQGGLVDMSAQTNAFIDGIRAFNQNLGPVFLQLSEYLHPQKKQLLFDYLYQWPKDISLFVEVRHSGWFENKILFDELCHVLEELKMGLVLTDTASRRDCAHMRLTTPRAFIRFVGNSLHVTDYTRIDEWVGRLVYWIENGLQELYFFMHMHQELHSPELIMYLMDKLQDRYGIELKKPILLPPVQPDSGKQMSIFD